MSHVILHCAEFDSEAAARAVEAALVGFCAAYAVYEREVHGRGLVPDQPSPPLIEFARAQGFTLRGEGALLIKGLAQDELKVVRIDRLVCFYAGGFELGGDGIEAYFAHAQARRYARDEAHLVVASEDPEASARALAGFLEDEDFEDQYVLAEAGEGPRDGVFSVRFERGETAWTLSFDDSGVQDWAFIACLPQLDGESPSLDAGAPRS